MLSVWYALRFFCWLIVYMYTNLLHIQSNEDSWGAYTQSTITELSEDKG
jgi:hypothetical protein